MNLLKIDNLSAETAGRPILDGFSFTINMGEGDAIMGPNGAGKSMLAFSPHEGAS